jgi:hypothetical protein
VSLVCSFSILEAHRHDGKILQPLLQLVSKPTVTLLRKFPPSSETPQRRLLRGPHHLHLAIPLLQTARRFPLLIQCKAPALTAVPPKVLQAKLRLFHPYGLPLGPSWTIMVRASFLSHSYSHEAQMMEETRPARRQTPTVLDSTPQLCTISIIYLHLRALCAGHV